MDRKQQVFLMLKPKVKALGFSTKELKGISARIADNLTSAEDASDEDVNAEIDKEIEAALRYLPFAQSQANRLLDEWKKNHPETDDDDDDGNEPDNTSRQPGSNKNNPSNKRKDDDTPAWVKGLLDKVDGLTNEISVLKGEKVVTSRKSKLGDLLKDSGSFGSRILKSFDRMKFETDEEFDEFYSEVEEDLKNYNQERANAGLAALTPPPAAGGNGSGKQDEPYSDAEIDALADL